MGKPKLRKRLKIESYISAKLIKAIGLLVIQASATEMMLSNALLRLIGTKHAGAFHAYPLVAGMDFKVKVSLIRIFTQMYGLSRSTEINATLDQIGRYFDLRNTVAHSTISPTRNSKERAKFQDMRAKPKLGSMPQPQVHTADHIRMCAIDLHRQIDVLNHHLTDSGVLTSAEYGKIDEANHRLDLQMAHILAEALKNPTTAKKPPEKAV